MRADNENFASTNAARAKSPRIVAQFAFDTAATDLYYFTSHADAALPAGAVATASAIKGVSGTSQRINPDKGRAEIGAITIELVDRGRAVTSLLATKLAAGDGLKGKRVRVYVGYQGLAWSDYVLVQTQIVQDVSYDRGLYTVRCADVQREMRKDLFDAKTTRLTVAVDAVATTLTVASTTGFEMVAHGSSYSDAPSATVGYLRIGDEIIRYTGKTANTFTGCTRGVMNTSAAEHKIDPNANGQNGYEPNPLVSEYVYLEMPAPKVALALLTGQLYGQGGATLPANWHLGINAAYVRTADFTGIGADWWDTTDDQAGVPLRIEGPDKSDGKKFVEEQILLALGAFSPVYSDGALGLKRMTRVLSDSGHLALLTASDIVSAGPLQHDMSAVINQIDIEWNWNTIQKRFTRRNTLIDANSIYSHGLSDPKKMSLRGIHGGKHSDKTLQNRFDSIRDRYAGPPERLRVQALHRWNVLEVGDVVRVQLDQVRDAVTGQNLDRAFEVQSVQTDWVSGNVSLDLFGSSQPAGAIAWGGPTPPLPDSWYTSAGTPLASVLTIGVTGGVGHVTANGTINGASTLVGGIYYYDGDLQIDAAVVVTITHNVQLRVRGHLQINGTVNGKGQGIAGQSTAADAHLLTGGNGTTQAFGATSNTDDYRGYWTTRSTAAPVVAGTGWQREPKVEGGALLNLPADLRGCAGGVGGSYIFQENSDNASHVSQTMAGGAGGAGGAGLLIVARGVDFGVAGKIDLSGADGALGVADKFYGCGGSGAGGAPGALLVLIDGTAYSLPLFNGTFNAQAGKTPVPSPGYHIPSAEEHQPFSYGKRNYSYCFFTGLYNAGGDLSKSSSRAAFLPDVISAAPDPNRDVVQPPSALVLASGDAQLIYANDGTIISRIKASWTASPNIYLKGHRVEYKRSVDAVWTEMSSITPKGTDYQFIAPVQDGVSYDVRVAAISKFGVESAWVTASAHVVVGKSAPPANVSGATAQFTSAGIKFAWNGVTDKDLKEYVIRVGASWAAGTQVVATRATNYLYEFKTAGSYTFWIAALDTSGNYSTVPVSVPVQINAPAAPALTATISGPDVFFSWDDPLASLPIVEFDLSYGDVFATRTYYTSVKANSTKVRINWSGSRRWWLEARDAAGNMGVAASADVSAVLPAMPSLRAEVVDHQVQLYFSATQGSLPIVGYRLRKGATFVGATLLGDIDGTFKLLMELVSGTYTYWCSALDSAGNEGPAASLAVRVDPPPNFQLKNDFNSSFTGTKNNCAVGADGRLLATINTTETWDSHFVSRGWTTPNDQVLAGFPIYIEPSATTGYYEESFDCGAVIGAALVAATITSALLAGAMTITPTLSTRLLATDPWIDHAGVDQAYAQNFQYVKIRYDFTSAGGDDLTFISALGVKVKVKLSSDAGKFTANATDVDGTQVNFTKTFLDVQSLVVELYSTAVVDKTVVLTGTTGFKVKAIDRATGFRLTLNGSYSADGFVNG